MIRFKVIKASQLIKGFIIALLVIALLVVVCWMYMDSGSVPTAAQYSGTSIVSAGNEKEVVAAFAAAPSLGSDGALFVAEENEHEDEIVTGIIIEKIPYDAGDAPATSPVNSGPKRVLIYHTHTCEAYQIDPDDPYLPLEPWRTADLEHSIVRVGAELARLLEQKGIEVVHDVTNHEPPKLGTAYTRSLVTLESYKDQSFDCYIDLHRDAYIESLGPNVPVTLADRTQAAQLMMLIGNGDGFDEKPYYTENMQFARQLTLALNRIRSGLCKNVLVKSGRYNQHIGKRAILVEVGNNMNTLNEALSAMPPLAEAVSQVLSGEVFIDSQLVSATAE